MLPWTAIPPTCRRHEAPHVPSSLAYGAVQWLRWEGRGISSRVYMGALQMLPHTACGTGPYRPLLPSSALPLWRAQMLVDRSAASRQSRGADGLRPCSQPNDANNKQEFAYPLKITRHIGGPHSIWHACWGCMRKVSL